MSKPKPRKPGPSGATLKRLRVYAAASAKNKFDFQMICWLCGGIVYEGGRHECHYPARPVDESGCKDTDPDVRNESNWLGLRDRRRLSDKTYEQRLAEGFGEGPLLGGRGDEWPE